MGLTIAQLNLGTNNIDKNKMVSYTNLATINDPHKANEIYLIPIQAFLIRSGDRNILFDTGCNVHCQDPENPRWTPEYSEMVCHEETPEQTIVAQIARFGLKPEDITDVVLSHMHADHVGGIEHFTNAQIYVHHDEFAFAMESYGLRDTSGDYIWKDTDSWTKVDLHWNFVERDDPDFELIPGVTIINLGSGHAHGCIALLVKLENTGNIILTGDAIYSPRNIEPVLTMPGVVYDTVGWLSSLKKLMKVRDANNAVFWYGHEMEQFERLAQKEFYD